MAWRKTLSIRTRFFVVGLNDPILVFILVTAHVEDFCHFTEQTDAPFDIWPKLRVADEWFVVVVDQLKA